MKKIISIALIIVLIFSHVVHAEPFAITQDLQNPYAPVVDGYKLEVTLFEGGKRVRIPKTGVFIDEFDYSIFFNKFVNAEAECLDRVGRAKAERDRLCAEEKGVIEKNNKEILDLCKKSKVKLLGDNQSLREKITKMEKEHSSEITKHYIIESAGGVVILGLLTGLVAISLK